MHWPIAVLMVGAELIGALIYYSVRNTFLKKAFSCIGLGFALSIVFGDILPDTTHGYTQVTGTIAAMFAAGILLTLGLSRLGKNLGGYAGILGFTVHNLCEGFIVTIVSTLSPLRFLGFVLHKLPEGMASYSLLSGLKPRARLAVILLSALMIPVGAFLPFSDESPVAHPFTAFAAGAVLAAVLTSLRFVIDEPVVERRRLRLGISLAYGMAIGILSCVLFG